MDDGNGGEDGDDPQDWRHAVEQSADDYEHQPLGALHETYTAGAYQRFGAGARIADHDRADHRDGGKDNVDRAAVAAVKHHQAYELGGIAVTVDYRVEESAEAGDAIAGSSHSAVDQVEEAGPDDDQASVAEHAGLVFGIGVSKEKSSNYIDDQAEEGENVGIDSGQRQALDDGFEQNAAASAEDAGPGFVTSATRVSVGFFARSHVRLVSRQPLRRESYSASEFPSRACHSE